MRQVSTIKVLGVGTRHVFQGNRDRDGHGLQLGAGQHHDRHDAVAGCLRCEVGKESVWRGNRNLLVEDRFRARIGDDSSDITGKTHRNRSLDGSDRGTRIGDMWFAGEHIGACRDRQHRKGTVKHSDACVASVSMMATSSSRRLCTHLQYGGSGERKRRRPYSRRLSQACRAISGPMPADHPGLSASGSTPSVMDRLSPLIALRSEPWSAVLRDIYRNSVLALLLLADIFGAEHHLSRNVVGNLTWLQIARYSTPRSVTRVAVVPPLAFRDQRFHSAAFRFEVATEIADRDVEIVSWRIPSPDRSREGRTGLFGFRLALADDTFFDAGTTKITCFRKYSVVTASVVFQKTGDQVLIGQTAREPAP